MACTRNSNYQNSNGTVPNTTIIIPQKFLGYPSFNPIINNLSSNLSSFGIYSQVYINGSNFQGTSFVNFGPYKNLPIIFYSSFNISFVVPLNAPIGSYNVIVVSIYNGNFSPQINTSYPGNQNYSNSITYNII